MAAEIYLVRHGETEWNRIGRIQGQSDSPLTSCGRAQAEAVGMILSRRFAGRRPPPFHVSPLGRARQTAAIIGRQIDTGVISIERRIQEVSLGAWDGLTHTEIEARYPHMRDAWSAYDWYFRAPFGESYEVALGRVRNWLEDLGGPVIAVSHGLAGRLIRGCYLNLSARDALLLPIPQDVVWHLAGGEIEALTNS